MEAHAETISIGVEKSLEPRRRRFAEIRAAIRLRRIERAQRAHALRMNGSRPLSVSGSEHSHLIRKPRGF